MSKEITKTIGQVLENLAQSNPNDIAIDYGDRDFIMTSKELNDESLKIAKGWLKLGIKKGDHVAIWATNVPEWILTLFSTAKIGAVLVTVNTNYKVFEADFLLRQSDTKALVLTKGFKDSNYIDIINELCPDLKHSSDGSPKSERLPVLERVIFAGENTPQGMLNFNELKRLGEDVSDEELQAVIDSLDTHDVVNMQYTSGTTGFPKGVMLTHYNILNNGQTIGNGMKFSQNDKLLICVPFFHCFGLVLAILACLTTKAVMVPVEYYQPKVVLNALDNKQCTALHGVPTMFIALLEHPDFNEYKFNLRTGIMAGSPCPIEVMKKVIEKMYMNEIVIVYGQTEASPGCTMTTTDDEINYRVNTVGRAFPGVETKIVDPETGDELGANMPGEFCARGYNIMKGYYKMAEATAQAIDKDGWLHTGDLATVDEKGYYKIVGRIKDMIIRGGENIYPKEIEEFLYTHPKVQDVQVVGVPSVQYGEEVLACIIIKEGETLTEEELREFVKGNIARHKTPRYIQFLSSFPTTASGKIQKFKLRENAIKVFNLQDAASIETA